MTNVIRRAGIEVVYAVLDDGAVRYGDYIARPISDGLEWGEGSISNPRPDPYDEQNQQLVALSLASIQPVEPEQWRYTLCTGGRLPTTTRDGNIVPVRPQVAGNSTTAALFVAEVMDDEFYTDPTASFADRASEVIGRLATAGIVASAHDKCAARESLPAVWNTITGLRRKQGVSGAFAVRTAVLLGDTDTSRVEDVLTRMLEQSAKDPSPLTGYSADVLLSLVQEQSGAAAVNDLIAEPKGVHGHAEQLILKLANVGQCAVNGRLLYELTGGKQIFAVNDRKLDELAKAMGGENPAFARAALEVFSTGVHATIGNKLPTYQVTRANAA